jgi:hypothetical protein
LLAAITPKCSALVLWWRRRRSLCLTPWATSGGGGGAAAAAAARKPPARLRLDARSSYFCWIPSPPYLAATCSRRVNSHGRRRGRGAPRGEERRLIRFSRLINCHARGGGSFVCGTLPVLSIQNSAETDIERTACNTHHTKTKSIVTARVISSGGGADVEFGGTPRRRKAGGGRKKRKGSARPSPAP